VLGWLYQAIERWGRASSARLDAAADYVPLWYVRRLAEAKLIRTLRHVWRNAPAQRRRWQTAGVRLGDLRSSEILPHLPLTEAAQLAENPDDFICVPREQLIHVLTTSGTKGKPKKVYLTADDLDRHLRMIGTHLRRFPGATRTAAIFNTDRPTWAAGPIARAGIEKAGMFGVLSHTGRSVDEQIRLIREYDIDMVITMPAYAHRMTVEADCDLRQLGIRYIHLGGQAWSEAFRRMLEDAWGAKVIDVYGCMECVGGIASECRHQDGLHVTEIDFWVEIVDPATGEVLPNGEEGEIVLTTLSKRGMPLVRYHTHDLARLLPGGERCACGLPLRKMSRVRGRADDTIIIGGDANVFADEFDRAFLSIPGVTDYQLVVEKDSYKDVLNLTVEGDRTDGGLTRALAEALLAIPHVKIAHDTTRTVTLGEMNVVARGTLSADRAKTVRVIDRRP